MKSRRIAATLLAVAAMAALPALAQDFGSDVRLSFPTGPAISNNPIVHASANNVYVAWSTFDSTVGHSEIWFRHSGTNGDLWNDAVNVSNRAGPDIEPFIVANGANVHVFWTDDVQTGSIYYARSTNFGQNFSAPVVIVNQPGYSRPTSAILVGAQVHLVFYDNRSGVGKVFHKLSCNSGATWEPETEVTQFDGDVDNEQPRIAQATTGDVFITFRSSREGVPQGGWPPFKIYLLRMTTAGCPGGAQWAYPAQRLSRGTETDLGGNYAPNIFTGSGGALHALWWNDTAGTNLIYRRGFPNGAGFGPQQDLSGFGLNHPQWEHMTERTGYGLGEDTSGSVHVVFLQNTTMRGGFQAGLLWHRCAPAPVGSAFVAKRLVTGSTVSEPRASYSSAGIFHVVWQDYRDSAAPSDQSQIYYNKVNANACTEPVPPTPPTPSPTSLDFGGYTMKTTSPTMNLTLTNNGAGNLFVTDLSASAGFGVASHNCAKVTPGGSCSVAVNFTPATEGTVNGTLTVAHEAGSTVVNLTGVGERSMVTHYYRAILNRNPEPGAKASWDSEAARMQGLTVDINETWVVMAGYFFNSAEYASYNKTNTQFVNDLYKTFFNRTPATFELDSWNGQLGSGLPREVVLFTFMFSPEFASFSQSIFGNTASRPEVSMVVDFYRGILNRLADTGGFNATLANLRSAQCNGASAVNNAVNSLSATFIGSGEYAARARNNTQYVTDMYYSFLRRGGDQGGVDYWINQLNTGAQTRDQVRLGFLGSGEFQDRVNAVIAAGCFP